MYYGNYMYISCTLQIGEGVQEPGGERSSEVVQPLKGSRFHHASRGRRRHIRAYIRVSCACVSINIFKTIYLLCTQHRRRIRSDDRRRGEVSPVHHSAQVREVPGGLRADHTLLRGEAQALGGSGGLINKAAHGML